MKKFRNSLKPPDLTLYKNINHANTHENLENSLNEVKQTQDIQNDNIDKVKERIKINYEEINKLKDDVNQVQTIDNNNNNLEVQPIQTSENSRQINNAYVYSETSGAEGKVYPGEYFSDEMSFYESLPVDNEEEVEEQNMSEQNVNQSGGVDDKISIFLRNLCTEDISEENLKLLKMELQANIRQFEDLNNYNILKYRLCNYLTNNDKILDGFFDNGPNNKDFSINLANFINHNLTNFSGEILRELIYIDVSNDQKLEYILQNSLKIKRDKKFYINLIAFINEYFSENLDDRIFNTFLINHFDNNKNNLLKLGEVRNGLDRHKSLLFKYICDKFNLPCCLIRNKDENKDGLFYDKHVWNLITIDGVVYIVDFKYHPQKIVKPTDNDSKYYYQIEKFIL